MEKIELSARPFMKWAGGKSQLLSQFRQHLPPELENYSFTYVEPFVGGGAMLFYMLQQFHDIRRVVINDINSHLTQAYRDIKDHPEELVGQLKNIEREYLSIKEEASRKTFYLYMRRQFNSQSISPGIERTSLLLFLNRTCFNGLYRENSKGEFNVPFGRYAHPIICNEDLIFADSELLRKYDVKICCGDYKQTINEIEEQEFTFFYFDPPYRPLSETSSFNTYVKEAFNDQSQRELALFCRQISSRQKCLWMLSNSDCSAANPNDRFFEDIYDGFNIQRVVAKRAINANPGKRGKLTELLIKNYDNTFAINQASEELDLL